MTTGKKLDSLLKETYDGASTGKLFERTAEEALKELISANLPDEQKMDAMKAIINAVPRSNRHILAFDVCKNTPEDSVLRMPALKIALSTVNTIKHGPQHYPYNVARMIYDSAQEGSELRTQALKKRFEFHDLIVGNQDKLRTLGIYKQDQGLDSTTGILEIYQDALRDPNLKTQTDGLDFIAKVEERVLAITGLRAHNGKLDVMSLDIPRYVALNHAPAQGQHADTSAVIHFAEKMKELAAKRGVPTP